MNKPVILSTLPLSPTFRERLTALYDLRGGQGPLDAATLAAAQPDVRAMLTLGSFRTDAALLAQMPQLGLICYYGTGFEGLDRAAAAARGIAVTHAGDANAASVAEFAMGLLLATARLIVRSDRLVRSGGWTGLSIASIPLVPGLVGRKLGIYGLGSIGQKIARRAEPFDCEIAYHNRRRRDDVPYEYKPSLLALAEWADILLVAVRAGPENRHAVNADILRALGAGGLLVNVSRGIALDTAALCDALENGTIAGAGLDVFEDEPHVPERLKQLENVVLTPHIGALSQSAQRAQQDLIVGNLQAFFGGGEIRSRIP